MSFSFVGFSYDLIHLTNLDRLSKKLKWFRSHAPLFNVLLMLWLHTAWNCLQLAMSFAFQKYVTIKLGHTAAFVASWVFVQVVHHLSWYGLSSLQIWKEKANNVVYYVPAFFLVYHFYFLFCKENAAAFLISLPVLPSSLCALSAVCLSFCMFEPVFYQFAVEGHYLLAYLLLILANDWNKYGNKPFSFCTDCAFRRCPVCTTREDND